MQVAVAGFGDRHPVLLASSGDGRQRLAKKVGDAGGDGVVGEASEVVGGVGLWVEVDQQRAITLRGTGGGKVAGDA
ncbi:hypothetical protein D3C80_2117640 [compost metagenome]